MSSLFLLATVAGRTVAIPSDQVESVVDIDAVTPIPLAADHIRGLAALRSRVVTVIDSRRALGAPGDAPDGRAVVTRVDGHHYAVLVEALDDVVAFEEQPLPNGVALDGDWGAVARGMIERDREAVLIIDIAALVPGPKIAA
ncbi:chemotaxis protein CheW [Stakelama saccharophila]|uniref:Chemotaxis protein CheW n=1 Tax=Stakelama saccharophila TaxID=3075605 RepID=A0ABZ0B6L3_9SPHN|nr:chemotaxis protein CheW [Stakelama sp. W311]WNO52771.1 chemotaxis protein CheW [Stakelama sp. W311]